MKRLLLILCLIPVLAFGQFSGAKKLLLQQGECPYNLTDYQTLIPVCSSVFSEDCSIEEFFVTNLSTAKQALDLRRSCALASGGITNFFFCIAVTPIVGDRVLDWDGLGNPVCVLFPISDYWGYQNINNFPLNSVPIYHIENGIITYIEYY